MATNPASTADIVARWRSLTSDEETVANTRLDDAWRKLKRDVPDLEARMDASGSEDLVADVVRVLADSVIRVLRNIAANGQRRRTVAVDDGTATWETDETNRATLYFTEDELGDLTATGKRRGARAYSVMPS